MDTDGFVIGVLARSDLIRCMARRDEDVAAAVNRAIRAPGEENFVSLEVEAHKGIVSVRGIADRKTTKEMAIGIAAQVPGVLEISDHLDWEWDDASVEPVANPTNANCIRRETWVAAPRAEAAG
ncbi:MAG: BON domain-containing protein [Actinomycetota bacterium]|nr:BON domain-containing protein [Actinomycetota bacterium]